MSTWLDDLKRQQPELYAAYRITGSQSHAHLRNMVRALELHPHLNSVEENARLVAAKFILSRRTVKASPKARRWLDAFQDPHSEGP